MEHRALVAYERTDGNYNLHTADGDGIALRLQHSITEATPFGSDRPTETAGVVYSYLTAGAAPDIVEVRFDLEACSGGDVDPIPRATDVTMTEAITDHLDPHVHEAFYVVEWEFEVTLRETYPRLEGLGWVPPFRFERLSVDDPKALTDSL